MFVPAVLAAVVVVALSERRLFSRRASGLVHAT